MLLGVAQLCIARCVIISGVALYEQVSVVGMFGVRVFLFLDVLFVL